MAVASILAKMSDLRAAKQQIRGQLLQLGLGGRVVGMRATVSVASAVSSAGRNVHAVGIGRKITEGSVDGTPCVRIYVVQKLPLSLLSPRDVVPKEIGGIPTDIVECAPAFLLSKKKPSRVSAAASATPTCSTNRRSRQRPVVAGISAGHRDITAGTLGCFCQSTRPGDDPTIMFALSNNHVFANVNQALPGDPLFQPGPADGGVFVDHFANLERFVPIRLGGTLSNKVDAAIGRILPNTAVDAKICSVGSISGTVAAIEDMVVRKHGRTTGLREGTIDDIELDALVGMDHGDPSVVGLFEDQLRIVSSGLPFGLGGDSGSLVIEGSSTRAVGLYFAGPEDGSFGLANKIDHVLNELQIRLV